MTQPKCEACGLIGGANYIYVRTTNGGLNLCPLCLADVNSKNPELKKLRDTVSAIDALLQGEMAHWPTCPSWNDFTEAGWSKCNCHLGKLRAVIQGRTGAA